MLLLAMRLSPALWFRGERFSRVVLKTCLRNQLGWIEQSGSRGWRCVCVCVTFLRKPLKRYLHQPRAALMRFSAASGGLIRSSHCGPIGTTFKISSGESSWPVLLLDLVCWGSEEATWIRACWIRRDISTGSSHRCSNSTRELRTSSHPRGR